MWGCVSIWESSCLELGWTQESPYFLSIRVTICMARFDPTYVNLVSQYLCLSIFASWLPSFWFLFISFVSGASLAVTQKIVARLLSFPHILHAELGPLPTITRPSVCTINLLVEAPLLSSHLYPNLSRPERKSMVVNIKDTLAASFIHPFPIGAVFFFVGKKYGLLYPCIGYWGLNNITIKKNYLLIT